MGASFPLVTKIYTGSARQLGKSIGDVYAVNTVGSILGAFCAGFILIPILGIRPSIVLNGRLELRYRMFAHVDEADGQTETGKSLVQGIGIGMPILNVGLAVILLLTVNQPLFPKECDFQNPTPW